MKFKQRISLENVHYGGINIMNPRLNYIVNIPISYNCKSFKYFSAYPPNTRNWVGFNATAACPDRASGTAEDTLECNIDHMFMKSF